MIDAIHGQIRRIDPNSLIVGTEVFDLECIVSSTTSSSISSLSPSERDRVTIYTYLHHKEDVMELYGFSTRDERLMFFELNKVQGIGPKQAIRILSGITVAELARALDSGDIDRLTQISGLGKKTAGKLVLALRGTITLSEQENTVHRGEQMPSAVCTEILHALTEMGYDKKLAREAVLSSHQELSPTIEDPKRLEEALFKSSIIKLA